VLLGANVGFLAIQSVDSGVGRSPTQILSYMSLVLSFGSIALGLTFITLDLTGRDRGSEAVSICYLCTSSIHLLGLVH
jgi:hypothetical protein